MKRTAMASLLGLLFSSNSYAAPLQFQTGDIVVTASRIPQAKETVIGDTTLIGREEIERAGAQTITDLLQAQPGVEINSNGGPGKTSGIFMRGTETDHVVVLIDGMRVNSATLGTTAFENIPLAQIDRIEILRGPASSLYGADAIGGVIHIFTRKSEGALKFYAGAGYGSYNTKTADTGFSGSAGDTSFALNVSSYDTDGYSAYRTRSPQFRDKDGYRNLSMSGSLTHKIMDGHSIGLQFFQSQGHLDYDSRFNFTDFGNNANISQLSYSLTSFNQITANWLSTLRLGQGTDKSENFSEVNMFNSKSRSFFETKQRQYSWQNDLKLPVGTLTLLYDRLEQRVSATADFIEDSRNNDGFMIGYLLNAGAHSVQTNYRSDHNNRYGTHDTGNVGYAYKLNQDWRVTASHGTAFKAPTFNDLFFPAIFGFPTSNPNLDPERSINSEASLRYATSASSASITAYKNRVKDLIALDANNFFLPFNINNAKIYGLTFAGSHTFDQWQIRGSLDVQSPRDKDSDNLLVRRANRHASLNLTRQWGDWRLGGEMIASSMRYNDAANTQRLAGYAIFNLTADYKINQDWKVQARVNNLLDKDYALAYDGNPNSVDPNDPGFIYNTAGSNLFVSVRYAPAK